MSSTLASHVDTYLMVISIQPQNLITSLGCGMSLNPNGRPVIPVHAMTTFQKSKNDHLKVKYILIIILYAHSHSPSHLEGAHSSRPRPHIFGVSVERDRIERPPTEVWASWTTDGVQHGTVTGFHTNRSLEERKIGSQLAIIM